METPEMHVSPIHSFLQSMSTLAGTPVDVLDDLPASSRSSIRDQSPVDSGVAAICDLDGAQYIACRFGDSENRVVVAGPLSASTSDEHITRICEALEGACSGLAELVDQEVGRRDIAKRVELLSSAAIAISSELSLETVLNRIVELARSISGAKYAALGVPGSDGYLERFITAGMTEEQVRAIGDPPRGHGVLGALIKDSQALRIPDIAEHPQSVGFPDNHPPMKSFLGVPIEARGVGLGNLYLTEKQNAKEFTDEDLQLVELLARHAAVAIENAQLYAQLETQEARLRFIIDQLPEAVILADSDNEQITLANRQSSLLLGWELRPPMPLREFLERNGRFDPNGVPLEEEQIPMVRSLRFGETVSMFELQANRPDGTRLSLLANSAPLRSPDGTVTAAALVFQDITRIKDAEQIKDDFLSLVSHELRTPLTTIHGGAHLLLQEGVQLDHIAEAEIIGDILTESRRLANLVENMVQLANIRAGRFRIEAEPVHVEMLARRSMRGIADVAQDREIRIEVVRDLLALGDPDSLDQVLRNLLLNAIKYVPDDTPIVVEAANVERQVHIAVRDFGPGVDKNDLPLLFDRFQRGSKHANTAGMGLGLYLSKMIVEAHDGELWVELPEDGGSRFIFSLPVAEEL
jgi:PAS domain S-box-containing protein